MINENKPSGAYPLEGEDGQKLFTQYVIEQYLKKQNYQPKLNPGDRVIIVGPEYNSRVARVLDAPKKEEKLSLSIRDNAISEIKVNREDVIKLEDFAKACEENGMQFYVKE